MTIKDLKVLSKDSLSYKNYLKVDELLSLQNPLSKPEEHDETLFIIIHQVYELWFKQILHEIDLGKSILNKNFSLRIIHLLKRIEAILNTLLNQVDILETMPPDDFNRFRNYLNPASGFQSCQFKLAEYKLGIKNSAYLKFFENEPKSLFQLKKALGEPSLYDCFLIALKKNNYKVPDSVVQRDFSKPYIPNEVVESIFEEIYKNPYQNSEVYLSLESLIDIDEKLRLWRYRHVIMVERLIGNMQGTGGSKGVEYLKSTLDKMCFPEIWQVRNKLGYKSYG